MQARQHLSELMHYCRDQVSVLALVDDNMAAQEAALRDKADVLVATPARLVAHLKAGNVDLKDTVSAGLGFCDPPRGGWDSDVGSAVL